MALDVSTLAVEVKSTGIKETSSELNNLFKEAGKAERRVQTLTASVGKLSTVFQQGTASAQAYQAAVAQANRQVGGHNQATTNLTQAMNALVGAIGRLNSNVSQGAVVVNNKTQAFKMNTNAMKDAHAAARGLSGALGALWVTYGNLIPLAAGLAIGASFKTLVKVGSDVEHTLEGIRVKGEESMESIASMRDMIKTLGQGVYGPQEVTKAFETLILAGLDAKQAMVGIKDAMNLAIVGGTSIEKASYTLVQVSTALGYTAEGFGRVGDVIAKTAAVSMSSVESLSEAFKSASAVGKLYGASLVDIGTGLAALSQLGIQGSAAGTSLKNFYKELATETDKLKNTLGAMKMKPADLKDAQGNFLDMVTVVDKLNTGLMRLSPAQQKLAMDSMANERGIKTLVEVLELYRHKTGEATNALQTFRDKIADSYAFTALGAAQMSLTVENQFKSMKNTLLTSLGEAFTEIQPQLLLLASRMKEVFRSEEFKRGVQGVANALSSLALFLAENVDKLAAFVAGFLAFKSVMFVMGFIEAFTAGVVGLTTAFGVARGAAIAFQASLGLLGAVLIAAGAAWAYYHSQKNSNADNKEKAALNNLTEYLDSLKKENERIAAVNEKLATGKSLKEADVQVTQEQAIAQAEANRQTMIAAALAKRDAAQKEFSDAKASRPWLHEGGTSGAVAKDELRVAEKELADAKTKGDTLVSGIRAEIDKLRAAYRTNATLIDQQAKEARDAALRGAGTGTMPDKDGLKQGRALDKELMGLDKLAAAYKERARAYEQAGETQLRVMAGVHAAQVQAEIDDGKYGKISEGQRERLMASAKAADEAKFALDGAKALAEQSMKLSKLHAVEAQKLDEVNQGQTRLTGAREAETVELLRQWNIAPGTARADRLLAEARAIDVLTLATEKGVKFNRGTEELKQQGRSHIEAGDALIKYGAAGKQTAIQLAALKVAQEQLNPSTQANLISQRMAAAALADFGKSYEDTAKLMAQLEEESRRQDGDLLAMFLSSEGEKVLAKKQATKDILDFEVARIEAARVTALLEGKFTGETVDAYNKAVNAIALARGRLEENTNTALQGSRLKDLASFLDETKALAGEMEKAFGGVGRALGGIVSALGDMQMAQERYNTALKEVSKLKSTGKSDDAAKATRLEEQAQKDKTKSEIKGYADLLGASKGFFKEHTAAYKVMNAAETAMRAAQLALAYEEMIRKIFFTETVTAAKVTAVGTEVVAETASVAPVVAAEAAKATAAGTSAVAVTASSLPFPYNLAAAVAMIAFLASIGVGMSGSGGAAVSVSAQRQATQGTGTVLGDEGAKSQSIGKSIELLAQNSKIELAHSSAMLSTLRNIRDGIVGMATNISRATGLRGTTADERALGVGASRSFLGFSSNSKTLVDSGIVFQNNDGLATVNPRYLNGGLADNPNPDDFWVPHQQTLGMVRGGHLNAAGYAQTHSESSSFFGLFHNSSDQEVMSNLDPALRDGMIRTLNALFDGVVQAAETFGQNPNTVSNLLSEMPLESLGLNRISLRGLSGDDLQKELEAVFSAAGDRMAEAAFGGLRSFQKAGEGYFETLVRVANGIDVANYAMERLGLQAVSYTAVTNQQGDVATEIVRETIMATERMSGTLNNIGRIIQTLDGSVDDLTATYKTLTEVRTRMNAMGMRGNTFDVNTIRGAGGLENLTSGLSEYMNGFFTDTERQAVQMRELRAQFAALGVAVPQTNTQFRRMVDAADDGTEAGNRLVGKLMSLAGAFNTATTAAREMAMSVVQSTYSSLAASVDAQKELLDTQYNAQVDAIKASADLQEKAQRNLLKPAEEALKTIQGIFDAVQRALKATAVESQALTAARRREAMATVDAAQRFANTGGDLSRFKGLTEALDTLGKPSEQLYGSFEEYARDQAKANQRLRGLEEFSKRQVDKTQLTIDGINATIDAIKSGSDAQLKALETAHNSDIMNLNATLFAAQRQIDALNGVDSSVRSVSSAMQQFGSAVLSMMQLQGTQIVTAANASEAVRAQNATLQNQLTTAISALQAAVASGNSSSIQSAITNLTTVSNTIRQTGVTTTTATPTVTTTNTAQAPVPTAVIQAYVAETIASGVADPALQVYQAAVAHGVSSSQLDSAMGWAPGTSANWAHDRGLQSFAVGTNYLPDDMFAMVHKGERIVPKADNAELMRRLDSPEDSREERRALMEAIQDLKQCIMSGDVANVQQTRELVKLIKKWDGEGMPEERDVDA